MFGLRLSIQNIPTYTMVNAGIVNINNFFLNTFNR